MTASAHMTPSPINILVVGASAPLVEEIDGEGRERLRRLEAIGGTSVLVSRLLQALSARPGVKPVFVETRVLGSGTLPGVVALGRALWGLRHAFSADVVTLHLGSRGLVTIGLIARLLCRIARKPIIVRVFGGSLSEEYKKASLVKKLALDYVLDSDLVLLETKALCEFAGVRFPGRPVRWFPNARPSEGSFAARPAHAPLRFVFVGAVREEKGVQVLIDAAELIDGAAFQLQIFGPPRGAFAEPSFLDRRSPIWAYRGVLDPEQVPGALRDNDVFVLPTYYEGEGYPGAIIEAFCAGLAVITTNHRAIPEIMAPQVGWLVEPGSVASLVAAMTDAIEHPAKVFAMKQRAVEHAKMFDEDAVIDQFVDYCQTLSAGGGLGSAGRHEDGRKNVGA